MKPKRPVSKRPRSKQKSPLLVDVLREDSQRMPSRADAHAAKTISPKDLDHFVHLYQAHLASVVSELKNVECLPGLFALFAALRAAEYVVFDHVRSMATSSDHAFKLCEEAIDIAQQYGGGSIIASQVLHQKEGVA